MSHYYALAIIPADGDLDELIETTLAPFNKNREVERSVEDGESYWHNPDGVWDWWSIGGRWTGVLSDYEPRGDPRNLEVCKICGGTGKRDDALGRDHRLRNPVYTCNGCDGNGRAVKWPTSWASYDGDVVEALTLTARISEIQPPRTIFVHGSERPLIQQESWNGKTFVDHYDAEGMRQMLLLNLTARMQAGLKDRVVVLDFHS